MLSFTASVDCDIVSSKFSDQVALRLATGDPSEWETTVTNRRKDLGLLELIAIALGGMIGGGIFAILGVATELVGSAASPAIAVGGALALLAAYSFNGVAGIESFPEPTTNDCGTLTFSYSF